ncbi:ThiF family adenylyltransferase [Nocardioides renjunii]|uniref:ThiF family adenylyltransferase n=1 Tax=Nocardioides renjunii TaxID=3095075 RepID=UPI002AFDCCB5|nr:ThiF family adenylyltransferase [Nocardioides sp. S-34]WQQ23879.1 ThiF family adenylyltransferase [Nocardioides sp. S-34]
MSAKHFAELTATLDLHVETAAVLTTSATTAASTNAVALLGQALTWVPDGAYLERHGFGLSIASAGWVPAFRSAIKNDQVPVFIHTHPGGLAFFSSYDDDVDAALAAAARDLGASAYASVVVAGSSEAPAVVARACTFDSPQTDDRADNSLLVQFHEVEAVRVAGPTLRLMVPPEPHATDTGRSYGNDGGAGADDLEEVGAFDRQVRMLGADGQRMLAATNVAIIGAGGTGSAVAVQLARIGVGSICLIDDDTVTPPTPTRGHGIRVADVGQPKVKVLGAHLRDIGLGTRIIDVQAPLHSATAIEAIQHADVVFSCVDGHGARMILNRFAYAHLAVVVDLAVLVAVSATGVAVDERVTWIGPGAACLLCRGRLDAAQAYTENLDPEARKRLAGEGYVQAAETPQPAVVTLTTLVAALGASEFLLRFVGIGSDAATELLLRPHIGELRRNRLPQRPGCFCSDPPFLGRGQKEPYLDLMWPEPPLTHTAGKSDRG